jgi:hypothetical protein
LLGLVIVAATAEDEEGFEGPGWWVGRVGWSLDYGQVDYRQTENYKQREIKTPGS